MSQRAFTAIGFSIIGGLAVYLAGCGRAETPATSTPPAASDSTAAGQAADHETAAGDSDHAHKPGAHGGTIVPIGDESYHAEVVFENGGRIRLFTLDADEARVLEIESQTVTAYVKPAGDSDAISVQFQPEPQADDVAGATSQFVAQLPEEFGGQAVEVTIPSIRIGGARFRLGFSSPAATHDEPGGGSMPEKSIDGEETALFLTPGGSYTEADIAANGRQVASEKFRGLKAKHDMNPKLGDKICPITETKANPNFAWVVGGQTYEFCCPPCVDEFVRRAKENPDGISDAGSYVRR